jgi:hypothetical protein
LLLYSSHLSLGVPNGLVIYHASSYFSGVVAGEYKEEEAPTSTTHQQDFSGAVAREEVEDFCEGSFSHTHPLLCYCIALLYLFYLQHFYYQKPKKIRIFGSCYFFTLVYHVVP